MSALKKLYRSPLIHVALAAGISIIVLAYFSKRILQQPLSDLEIALPSILMTLHFSLYSKYREKLESKTHFWVIGILLISCIIILRHLI